MTKLLIENNYIEPSNVILGPSIKVHLIQNDMEGALNEFEQCCKQYRSTPWKGELMKSLILAEDATKLQWLADLSTQVIVVLLNLFLLVIHPSYWVTNHISSNIFIPILLKKKWFIYYLMFYFYFYKNTNLTST